MCAGVAAGCAALAELIKDLAASPSRDREETIERWIAESTDERRRSSASKIS